MKSIIRIFMVGMVLTAYSASAQLLHKRWEVGGMLGLSGYLGDLNQSDFFSKEPKFGGGVMGRYHINRQLALRGGLTFGSLSGNDANYANRVVRGFKVKSPITDLSAIIEWDFLGKRRTRYDSTAFQVRFKKTLSPYLFTGLGVAFTSPKPDFTGTPNTPANFRQGAIADQAKNYSNVHGVIPFGVGLRYDLSENWVLGAEAGFRLAFSDYLDGISQAANPGLSDRYKLSGISLTYRFNNKDKDRDGILDAEDSCPTEPGSIRMKGCPDKDNDGVADKDDDCPDTFGLAALKGCPDADSDGIRDKDDDCPNEAGLATLNGCPDRDRDGIRDKDDDCPDVAGLAALKGCPDGDKDGIADKDDDCPTVAGLPQFKGCPDTDNDGVPDKDDACPTVAGKVELKGCPDGDNDGIADQDDACPTVAGLAQFSGCPDTDKDGVEDAKDLCPDDSGSVDFGGCATAKKQKAVLKEIETKARLEEAAAKKQAMLAQKEALRAEKQALKDGKAQPSVPTKGNQAVKVDETKRVMDVKLDAVLFETGQASIQNQYNAVLDAAVDVMTKNPGYTLRIVGHADAVGSAQFNQRLSEKRAEACFDYLLKKGVAANRMSFVGYGEEVPAATNDTPEGRQRNRRVEVGTYRN